VGATAKVSEQDIRVALKCWRGNVSAAAHALGISENALRKRLRALGIGAEALSFLRSAANHTQPHPTKAPSAAIPNRPLKNTTPNFPRLVEEPTFASVGSTETVVMRRPQTRPARLRPDQIDALRDAKFDYQAKHRRETEESDLLQQFFDESFHEWLKRALAKKEDVK